MFEHKKIFILGMARSGYEVAKLLAPSCNILITDMKEQDHNLVEELKKMNVKVEITEKAEELLDDSYDYMIKNPGISKTNIAVIKANKLGIKVINEVEAAYQFLKTKNIIGVTGSNGKTTTVILIYEILKEANLNPVLGGNVGIPLSRMAKDIKKDQILVIEISDHQLCDMYDFKTHVSVLTNLYEVHLDFHKDYDEYKMIKKRIFNHHLNSDIAVLNFDNSDVMELTKDIVSKKEYFSSKQKKDCYIDDIYMYYNNKAIIKLNDIKLKGTHNYENIMAAILAVKEYNVSDEIINKVLMNFNGVEHRLEYVKEVNGRIFYNDSKATNVKSTQIALSSFNEPTILILGGLDRGHFFDGLTPYLSNVKYIIGYADTKEKIKEYAEFVNIPCSIYDKFDDAVLKAYEVSNKGDIILLSPACAAWYQFENFEKRGEKFKEIINTLK